MLVGDCKQMARRKLGREISALDVLRWIVGHSRPADLLNLTPEDLFLAYQSARDGKPDGVITS